MSWAPFIKKNNLSRFEKMKRQQSWSTVIRYLRISKGRKRSNNDFSIETDLTSSPLMEIGNKEIQIRLTQENPLHLFKLASEGRLSELECILEGRPKVINKVDAHGMSLLHYAASESRTYVMEFLLSKNVDIDHKDRSANTALHVAVIKRQIPAAQFLLLHGVNPNLLNKRNMAPLHIVCSQNDFHMLQELINHKSVNLFLPGEHGASAAHYSCFNNSIECLKILFEHGYKFYQTDSSDFSILHIAIKCGSISCLNIIIEYAIKNNNVSRRQMMNTPDLEGNVALHAAVNAGDIDIVKICLNNDAHITVTENNLLTPVHYACIKGQLEMVKNMFQMRPEEKFHALQMRDTNGHTPLHKAAMFDHCQLVTYLFQESNVKKSHFGYVYIRSEIQRAFTVLICLGGKYGSKLETTDEAGYTPLLLAASESCFKAIATLLHSGANPITSDFEDRNIIHLSILRGNTSYEKHKPPNISNQVVVKLLNQKDCYGCTPLHYASQQGYVCTTATFLDLGATCLAQNNTKDTPLHFAARFGRYNTCKQLLASAESAKALNYTDHTGRQALHVAAEYGHLKVVKLLLEKGCLFHRCFIGNSPLHLAASNGHVETAKFLLDVNPSLLNAVNSEGKTALHVATEENQPAMVRFLLSSNAAIVTDSEGLYFTTLAILNHTEEVAKHIVNHNRWQEVLNTVKESQCPIVGFIREMPSVCTIALNKCVTSVFYPKTGRVMGYKYNFKILQKQSFQDPLYVVKLMVSNFQVDLLHHPLCMAYMRMKWRRFGRWIHWTNMIIYAIFLACLTFLAMELQPLTHFRGIWDKNALNARVFMLVTFITIYILLNVVKEISQLVVQRFKYFLDYGNYIEWGVYLSVSVFVCPLFVGEVTRFQFEAKAFALFLAWFKLMLFFQRFEVFGIYVVMFLEILKNLLKAVLVFSILIIAFGFSFYVLLTIPEQKIPDNITSNAKTIGNSSTAKIDTSLSAWQSPHMAILKAVMMMMGEYDYLSTFVAKDIDNVSMTLHFPQATYFMLILFIFLVPVLLMNLLIGLAVGDIESVRRNASLKRIAMQVDWLADLELKIPVRLRRKLNLKKTIEYITTRAVRSSQRKEVVNNMDFLINSSKKVEGGLHKQKLRITTIQVELKKMSSILNLIKNKFSLEAEADEIDEGITREEMMMQDYFSNKSLWRIGKSNKSSVTLLSKSCRKESTSTSRSL